MKKETLGSIVERAGVSLQEINEVFALLRKAGRVKGERTNTGEYEVSSEEAEIILQWAGSGLPLIEAAQALPPEPVKHERYEELSFEEFAARYCERQEQIPEGLKEVLLAQKGKYQPDGWMLLECHVFGSSRFGSLAILPFGPNNTFKEVPDHPVSPRGLASDMSAVVAVLRAADLQ